MGIHYICSEVFLVAYIYSDHIHAVLYYIISYGTNKKKIGLGYIYIYTLIR